MIGSTALVYFIILECVEPGRFFDFKLFWLFSGVVGLLCNLFYGQIRCFIRAVFLKSKLLRFFFFALTAVFLTVNAGILWYICSPAAVTADTPRSPAYLVVLGGGIRKNGDPSRTLAARLDAAIRYARANPHVILIASGGKGTGMPHPEADTMERYLTAKGGISGARILKEDTSLDTIQNLVLCRKLIREREGTLPSVAILTSDSHLKRALLLARRSGYTECVGVAAPTELLFVPNNYTREIASYWKLGLRLIFSGT